jgi:hypothetical protein
VVKLSRLQLDKAGIEEAEPAAEGEELLGLVRKFGDLFVEDSPFFLCRLAGDEALASGPDLVDGISRLRKGSRHRFLCLPPEGIRSSGKNFPFPNQTCRAFRKLHNVVDLFRPLFLQLKQAGAWPIDLQCRLFCLTGTHRDQVADLMSWPSVEHARQVQHPSRFQKMRSLRVYPSLHNSNDRSSLLSVRAPGLATPPDFVSDFEHNYS